MSKEEQFTYIWDDKRAVWEKGTRKNIEAKLLSELRSKVEGKITQGTYGGIGKDGKETGTLWKGEVISKKMLMGIINDLSKEER